MKFKLIKYVFYISIIFCSINVYSETQVAITIDDIPNCTLNKKETKLLKTLDSLQIPICIFISSGKIYPNDFSTAGLYFIDGNEAFGSPWFEWREKYLKKYKAKDNENTYLIWKADYDNSPDGDIRCD